MVCCRRNAVEVRDPHRRGKEESAFLDCEREKISDHKERMAQDADQASREVGRTSPKEKEQEEIDRFYKESLECRRCICISVPHRKN